MERKRTSWDISLVQRWPVISVSEHGPLSAPPSTSQMSFQHHLNACWTLNSLLFCFKFFANLLVCFFGGDGYFWGLCLLLEFLEYFVVYFIADLNLIIPKTVADGMKGWKGNVWLLKVVLKICLPLLFMLGGWITWRLPNVIQQA